MEPDSESRADLPVACTLTTKEAAGQTLEWGNLQERAVSVVPLDRGARMTFWASARDDVEDLVRRERACCAFLNLETSLTGHTLTLDITGESTDARSVIQLLAGIEQR